MPKRRIRQGLQHAHHGVGDACTGYEFDNSSPRTFFFAVKADDESSHHPQAIGGDLIDRILQ